MPIDLNKIIHLTNFSTFYYTSNYLSYKEYVFIFSNIYVVVEAMDKVITLLIGHFSLAGRGRY